MQANKSARKSRHWVSFSTPIVTAYCVRANDAPGTLPAARRMVSGAACGIPAAVRPKLRTSRAVLQPVSPVAYLACRPAGRAIPSGAARPRCGLSELHADPPRHPRKAALRNARVRAADRTQENRGFLSQQAYDLLLCHYHVIWIHFPACGMAACHCRHCHCSSPGGRWHPFSKGRFRRRAAGIPIWNCRLLDTLRTCPKTACGSVWMLPHLQQKKSRDHSRLSVLKVLSSKGRTCSSDSSSNSAASDSSYG